MLLFIFLYSNIVEYMDAKNEEVIDEKTMLKEKLYFK